MKKAKNKKEPLKALIVYPVEVNLPYNEQENLDLLWDKCIAEADLLLKSNQIAPVIVSSNVPGLGKKIVSKNQKNSQPENQFDFHQVILNSFNQIEDLLALIQRLNCFLNPLVRDRLSIAQHDVKKLFREFLGISTNSLDQDD